MLFALIRSSDLKSTVAHVQIQKLSSYTQVLTGLQITEHILLHSLNSLLTLFQL